MQIFILFRAVRGNWRNAMWIECKFCFYGKPVCSDHLLTMDQDGRPILFPVSQFQHLTGETLDKEECIAALDCLDFEKLYSNYLLWNVDDPWECSLLQLGKKHDNAL